MTATAIVTPTAVTPVPLPKPSGLSTADVADRPLPELPHAQQLPAARPPVAVHTHVVCAHCHTSPVVGVRYSCSVCANVDLCAACFATHDPAHLLLAARVPVHGAHR